METFLAERNTIELVQHRLVKAFTDSVRLWALRLGPGMIDTLQCELELIFVMLGITAIFGAAIGQNT
jgi:hypothetical protein